MVLERPPPPPRGLAGLTTALDRRTVAAGAVAALFATTGPLALLLAVAGASGLDRDETVGWIFAGYGFGGVLSILFSALYRQPIGMAWSIPGAAMLLAALDHLSFAEAVGAYLVCGLAMAFLGLTGWIGRLTALVPAPVAMAMVAGVFLPFATGLVGGFADSPVVAGAAVAGYALATAFPAAARSFPPMLAALLAGAAAVAATGGFAGIDAGEGPWIALPAPAPVAFDAAALAELVPPLLVSVIAIQNLQGFAVLSAAGHRPPMNALTLGCGYGSLAMGAFGSVPACVTGPVNAILTSVDPPERRWAGGIVFGALIGLFGLFAPVAAGVAAGLPPAFVAVLGGLAMLPVLNGAFASAFAAAAGRGAAGALGPLVAFVVTVSGIAPLNIGAPFWGLVFGSAVWFLIDRRR